jgi:hypothetical protein
MCTPECRDAGRPVALDYSPVGKHEQVDGLDVYVVGSGKRAIVFITDIFGVDFKQVHPAHHAQPHHSCHEAKPQWLMIDASFLFVPRTRHLPAVLPSGGSDVRGRFRGCDSRCFRARGCLADG